MMTRILPPAWLEDDISQLPALHLLQQLGYTYLTPDEALTLRDGRESNVFLTGMLADWLRRNNSIERRGRRHPISEANIVAAIRALAEPPNEPLVRASEAAYHLLRLGKSVDQLLDDGATGNTTLRYLNWTDHTANVYHVTEEFRVTRKNVDDTYRPDLVLFVNGIPFTVIECKRQPDEIDVAISQHLRNQKPDGIERLYVSSQILFALATSEARYATVGTERDYWAPWREEHSPDDLIAPLFSRRLPEERERAMLALRPRASATRYEEMVNGGRDVTEQDRLLWSLARPERLLRMARRYVLFDAGVRKIARHQQVAAVEHALTRLNQRDATGRRKGGVIWHTQGSGKSLTMVYLATALAEEMH